MNRGQEATRERADIAFALYHEMGDGRSLRRLHEQLRALGAQISLATLKRYSVQFRWQEQLAGLNAKAAQQQHERGIQHVLTMLDRHAQLARAVQGAGGNALRKLMSSDRRLTDMRPAEIARLLELGLKAERQAFGDSSDRREIALLTWNTVTTEVVKLFNEVNSEPDEEARSRLFARGLDRVVDTHLAELKAERETTGER